MIIIGLLFSSKKTPGKGCTTLKSRGKRENHIPVKRQALMHRGKDVTGFEKENDAINNTA